MADESIMPHFFSPRNSCLYVVAQVLVRRSLCQVDVGRDRDAGGQRRVQRVVADVQLLQELADPLRRRGGELATFAGLHLLLRRGQRQGHVPAHQQGRVPGRRPRRVQLRVPHQELVARPQVASPSDVAELRNQGWRAGVGDNAGGSAARHAELDEHLRCV
jgi:hypothetical protein